MREGKHIKLKGISRHGKNRINQHGEEWVVLRVDGPKVLLRSLNKTFKDGPNQWSHDMRWVNTDFDSDFEIVEREQDV